MDWFGLKAWEIYSLRYHRNIPVKDYREGRDWITREVDSWTLTEICLRADERALVDLKETPEDG